MKFTRRKFLRFAPASIGSVALGVMVLPKLVPVEPISYRRALNDAMFKAVDPPFGEVNVFPGGVSYTYFEKIGDQLFSIGSVDGSED